MKKIIVIEDDNLLREVLRETLKDNGYKVFTASGGEEGISLISEIIPDLILCDIMMPGTDGYDVKRQLSKSPVYNAIPFIFLTAKNDMADLRYGMELGADDYLVKPFEADAFLHSVEVRLRRSEKFKKEKSEKASEADEKLLTEKEVYLVNNNNSSRFIRIEDIVFITAIREYSDLFLSDKSKLLVRKPLKAWEKKLPPNIFLRIYRSTIVNVNYISKIEKKTKKSYKVLLTGFNEELVISRLFASRLKSKLAI